MKDTFLHWLVAGAPRALARFDPETGRFMDREHVGPGLGWAVTLQDVIYPLAVLHKIEHAENPYFGDEKVLDAVARGGDAVRAWQNPDGTVEFIKVDGSTWGPTYMCWTMYHWTEAYALVADDLDDARRKRWAEGLRLAYDGIMEQERGGRIHNIPCWNGMGLVRAGQVFGRDEWLNVGRDVIARHVAAQTGHGYWNEHGGPTTSYNLVYVHAIGLYHAFTGDESVLDCLRRGLEFFETFSYPDGANVETIDGRVKYKGGSPDRCLAAHSLSPRGRRFGRWLAEKIERAGGGRCTPAVATAYEHWVDGPEEPIIQDTGDYERQMGVLARVWRRGKWFGCVSAITVEKTDSRWGMDRQSFLGLYHDACGLVVGGGNSKDTPAWSNFSVGDAHVPGAATLTDSGVRLTYGKAQCEISVEIQGETARITLRLLEGDAATGRLPLHVRPGEGIATAKGETLAAGEETIRLTADECGGWIGQGGWRAALPPGGVFEYPVRPFNPYAKGGNAPLGQAVGVASAPLDAANRVRVFEISAVTR